MLKFLIPYLFVTTTLVVAQSKEICITVDDLPTVHYGENNQKEITQKLITHFRKNAIPAIGFVNEGKLYEAGELRSERIYLLRQWVDNGYELGNHTFSHTDYHLTTFTNFTRDVLKGAEVTPALSKKAGVPWRYFRHPYLHIGQNQTKFDSLHTFLIEQGYTEAPVTIDNDDYLFAKAYSNAHKQGDEIQMKRIGSDYITYMEAKVQYYELLSTQLFDREIPQVLLIHASLLNADYVGELAEMYRRNGYAFIDLPTALSDTAYQQKVTKFGSYGISWMERWAISQSLPGSFFAKDPKTPPYIVEAAR